ncbi:MAG: HlyD family secretion protein [Acidobacteria bacterium]|nr:HlyD family secretion protein [Acidobacteriota bacterium]
MTISRFFAFIGVVFLIALVVYLASTPRTREIELTGVVTGPEVMVSPKIAGRIERLLVDEGSEVKLGQLIAQLDSAELAAQRDFYAANIRSLEARVGQVQHTWGWTNEQTEAALNRAMATLTAAKAQLEEARADLWRNEVDYKRTVGLFESGVASAQDRDRADAALRAVQAKVKSLEDQVKAQEAEVAVARANRKQLDVQQSDLASTRAQLEQARAAKAEAETRLGYTQIYAPLGGIVSVRVTRQGEVVQAGAPIVTIIDIDHLWVRAGVEETYADSIQFGQKLKVRLPSGERIEGTVFFKGVESDFATQRDVSRTKRDVKTFAIKVAVPNEGRRLFAGMTATVLLPPPANKKSWLARWSGAPR